MNNIKSLIDYMDKSCNNTDTKSSKHINKKKLNFIETIKNVGGRDIEYISNGSYGIIFKFIISDENKNNKTYAIKIVPYLKSSKYGDINNEDRPENAEILVMKLLSKFVLENRTPHIIIPFATFNCDIDLFVSRDFCEEYCANDKNYLKFIKQYENNHYHDIASVLIFEWINKGDLGSFLQRKYKKLKLHNWKTLFFQILSVLATIHEDYPAFKHNDFKVNNILIMKYKTEEEYIMYTIYKTSYKVVNINYFIKMCDFDFACIENIVDNIKVEQKWAAKYNVNSTKNKYYDVYYFFKTLTTIFLPNFIANNYIDVYTKAFVMRMIPAIYNSQNKECRLLSTDEYTTPRKILETDEYFAEYRI